MTEYHRIKEWREFSEQIERHITAYTREQYGGNPDGSEQVDGFTTEDCWKQIDRYMNRRKSNVRGNRERLRDLLKVAHYASFIYAKLKAEDGEEDVYG